MSGVVDIDKSSLSNSKEGVAAYASEAQQDPLESVECDAVFGERKEHGVDYRSVGWIKATVLLLKTLIALGVLAMPTVLATVGGVPGSLIIVLVGALTTWSGYVVGTFKRNHPEVYSMDDVGFVLGGRIGREFFGAIYALLFVALVGSGLVAVSIALNAVSLHAMCTVGWVAIAAIITFSLASIQTLNKVSAIGWVGLVSVISAIMVIVIAVSVQDRPAAAPATGAWDKKVMAFNGEATFLGAMGAVSTVVFSYCGTPAFFNVVGEMRKPRDYTKAVVLTQSIVTMVYLIIGIIVYYYCGRYVSSPALGSAGPLLKRVAYGIAIPGLFASITIYTHVVAKMIFVRTLRGSHHLTENTFKHWAVWLGTVASCVLGAFIIAEAIPFFNDLVNLIGASLGSFLCMQTMGWMWLHDNLPRRHTDKSVKYWLLVALNVFLISAGFFVQISGTIGAAISIKNSYKTGAVNSPFSCVDNSGS